MFDHTSIDPELTIPTENVALSMLTLQHFSTGGKVGQGVWHNIQYNRSTFAAPCIKALHTFIRVKNLLDSIHWNLLCKKGTLCGVENLPNGQWGRPIWEKFPASPDDTQAFFNAGQTYLGRLVPFSRMINLVEHPGRCIVGPVPPDYKIEHLPCARIAPRSHHICLYEETAK